MSVGGNMFNFCKMLVLVILMTLFILVPVQATDYYHVNVGYQAGNESVLGDFAYGGALAGTEGGEPLDSLELHLVDGPYNAGIEYRVYTTSGWSEWLSTWETASNNNEALLGLQIQLKDFPNANVYYQSYRKGLGWGTWQSNGSTSGQLNSAYPITGFRVQVDEIGVEYKSSVGGVNQVLRHNGETQGTGSIDSVSMNLISADSGSIEYRAYIRNVGWTDWARNRANLGSSGSVIEALEARLIDLPQYSVQIQPQVEGEWWGYVYDGQTAGSIGSRLTAYRVEIVQKLYVQASMSNVTLEDVSSYTCPSILSNQIYLYVPSEDMRIYVEGEGVYYSLEVESETPYSPYGYWGNEITVNVDLSGLQDSPFNDSLIYFYYLPSDYFNNFGDLSASMNILKADDKLYICYGSDFELDDKVYLAQDIPNFSDYDLLDEKLGWYWMIGNVSYNVNDDTFTYNEFNRLEIGSSHPQ